MDYIWECSNCGKRSWIIVAQGGVASRTHCDICGSATYLEELAGTKLWAVRVGSPMSASADDDHPSRPEGMSDQDYKKILLEYFAHYEVILVRPGDGL